LTPDHRIDADDEPLWKRLGWMGVIWSASVCALGIVAYAIRAWIGI
jgi:hypothetical protein